jgi:hypothetical protein
LLGLLVAVLALAGIAALAGKSSAATARPVAVAAVAHTAITQGTTVTEKGSRRGCAWTTTYKFGGGGNPPGWAQVTINSESPSGCEQFRPNITASDLQCPPGQGHCRFTGGWIKSLTTSYVNTCGGPPSSCPGVDGGTLDTAYLDRRPTGTTSWQCKNEVSGGSWRNCSANVKTTAVVNWLQRSCSVGQLSWAQNAPGQLPGESVVLDTADSPAGCEQVLARSLSTGGHTYRSGLIRNPGTATAFIRDGTQQAKAWAEKQPYNDPAGRRCKQVYPNVEVNWHDCTG